MKMYQEPVTEIVEIEAADVITASGIATNRPATDYNDWKSDANGNAYRPSQN